MSGKEVNYSTCKCELGKDSRRSWYVCLGAFLLVGFTLGINNSFGVLFVSLVDEFQDSKTKIAWVGSFEFFWFMIISPGCNNLTRSFGFRTVALVGSILFSLGLLLTSFAHNLSVLYATYGLLFGTGTCLLYIPSVTVLAFCFERYFSTACGIVASANGLFTLWIGPVYEYLIRHYGWRMALKILTLLVVPLALGCASFPNKKLITLEIEKKSKMELNFAMLRVVKNQAFLLWLMIMFLVYLGAFVPFMHLISFSQDVTIATKVSVYAISCLCAFDTIGKLVVGKLLDFFRWDMYRVNSTALLVMAISITLLPLTSTALHLFLFAAFYGFALGVQSLSVLIITPQLCEPKDSKHALTSLFAALSIPGGVGPAVAGWIYDSTCSYQLAFFIAGGFFATASCFGVLLPLLVERTCGAQAQSLAKESWCENPNDIVNTKDDIQLREFIPGQSLQGYQPIWQNNKSPKETVFEYLSVV